MKLGFFAGMLFGMVFGIVLPLIILSGGMDALEDIPTEAFFGGIIAGVLTDIAVVVGLIFLFR